jgi:hypothetical protein
MTPAQRLSAHAAPLVERPGAYFLPFAGAFAAVPAAAAPPSGAFAGAPAAAGAAAAGVGSCRRREGRPPLYKSRDRLPDCDAPASHAACRLSHADAPTSVCPWGSSPRRAWRRPRRCGRRRTSSRKSAPGRASRPGFTCRCCRGAGLFAGKHHGLARLTVDAFYHASDVSPPRWLRGFALPPSFAFGGDQR